MGCCPSRTVGRQANLGRDQRGGRLMIPANLRFHIFCESRRGRHFGWQIHHSSDQSVERDRSPEGIASPSSSITGVNRSGFKRIMEKDGEIASESAYVVRAIDLNRALRL